MNRVGRSRSAGRREDRTRQAVPRPNRSITSSRVVESEGANDLIRRGLIHPTLSKTYALEQVGQAAYDVHRNLHQGKVGVLALAPQAGLGVTDPAKRQALLNAINRFSDA